MNAHPTEPASGSPKRAPRKQLITIHADSDLHVIGKPAGWSTVSERWDPQAPTAVRELWKVWQKDDADALKPHIVHRLDKDTSGLLVFARHRDAQAELRRQFREREVKKCYLALVAGIPRDREGNIEIEIGPDPRRPGKMRQVRHGGKKCETRYEVVEHFRDLSWVRLHPTTGRTHQIRVSLASIGHPVAIDPLYGSADPVFLSRYKRRYRSSGPERPLVERLTLHAESLTFTHPSKGEVMTLRAPLPRDLAATLRQLQRWARS